jgi:hypothetical protein
MMNAPRSGAAPQPDIWFGALLKENQFNRPIIKNAFRTLARDTSM